MLLFIFAVIVLFPKESLQKCTTTYVTQCDSLEDIQKVDIEWTDVIVGSINENNNPSSKFHYTDLGRLGHLNSFTIIGQLDEIEPSYSSLYRCNIQVALKILIFYGNKLPTIKARSFPVIHLEKFSLGHNEIEVIEKNAFFHGPISPIFDVSYNLLDSIERSMFDYQAFAGAHRIQKLDLRHNKITHIQSGSFPTSLQVLHLQYNKIKFLQKDLFHNMSQLYLLNISNNQLYALPDFDGLVSLMFLDLSRNKLEALSPTTFANLTNLRILELSNNMLYSSSFLSKSGLVNKFKLLLSVAFNRLSNVANLTDIIKPTQELELSLFGNFWECDIWEKMTNTIATTKGLEQNACDALHFSNGQLPYCINTSLLVYYDEDDIKKDFSAAIKDIKGHIPCKLTPSPIESFGYTCVL